jgi:hypothetical protein
MVSSRLHLTTFLDPAKLTQFQHHTLLASEWSRAADQAGMSIKSIKATT